eukprot:Tamp_13191.p8 GENE.Tamp_13191~~Tamp_13191.p8  ORF type:complete len:107 (-),score=5.26 Tamp_13191:1107-1427(-)
MQNLLVTALLTHFTFGLLHSSAASTHDAQSGSANPDRDNEPKLADVVSQITALKLHVEALDKKMDGDTRPNPSEHACDHARASSLRPAHSTWTREQATCLSRGVFL